MKQLITNIKSHIKIEYTGLIVALFAVLAIPAAAFAWGPARSTYTMRSPADHVTFNSITDNPVYGDERNFMRVRPADSATGTAYTDTATLTPGKEYQIMVFYHNNAASNLNASGVGIAKGAYARAEVPAVVKTGTSEPADAYVGATNANPTNVYDDITFTNSTAGDIALRYVPSSTKIHSFGAVNNATLPDTILSTSGVTLGYSALDGTLPGCNDYSGYVTFNVKAEQPNFTFTKQVRVSGTSTWSENVTVKPGDKVDYMLGYDNTGTTAQSDVVLKDTLPEGLTYVTGSSKIKNTTHPNGDTTSDGIGAGGINIGNYTAGANAYLLFTATVGQDADCKTLTNTAGVETNNGNLTDTATVTVNSGSCTTVAAATALPTTGPGEVIVGILGLFALTFGIVYFFKSRRDLQTVLHSTQMNPTFSTDKTAAKSTDAAHTETHHETHHETHVAHQKKK